MTGLAALVVTVVSGFAPNDALALRMQPLAGKPITVYCPATQADWSNYVTSRGGPVGALGHTPVVGGSETYLSYSVCQALVKRESGKSMTLAALAQPILLLTHETEHMRGIEGEHDADCAALAVLPQTARAFGIRNAKKIKRLVALARAIHAGQTLPYGGPC